MRGSEPRYQRSQPPVRHKLHAYEERLQLLYEQNLALPRRERRTVLKLYEQLVEEGYTGSCSPVYRCESQEMVLDAFVRALSFYGGVPRRVIIDNPKTMVTYVSRSKDRTIDSLYQEECGHLRPLGQAFDGYVEKRVRVRKPGALRDGAPFVAKFIYNTSCLLP